ncbi:MAG: hypothetical protein ACUZ77_07310, partial [Candidatus Brocadiales bacterium]
GHEQGEDSGEEQKQAPHTPPQGQGAQKGAQHEKREMSKEDAERVLEALGRSEKEAREWRAKQRHVMPGRVEKDW